MAADAARYEPPCLHGPRIYRENEPGSGSENTGSQAAYPYQSAGIGPVSPELVQFARQFFPEISETTVQQNRLEIMNCKSDREKELAENSKFRTTMAMTAKGDITLFIRKII